MNERPAWYYVLLGFLVVTCLIQLLKGNWQLTASAAAGFLIGMLVREIE